MDARAIVYAFIIAIIVFMFAYILYQFSKIKSERESRVEAERTAEAERQQQAIAEGLSVLDDANASPREKGEAFVGLIEEGYVLEHHMSGGPVYDDGVQTRRFSEGLAAPGYADALMSVGERRA